MIVNLVDKDVTGSFELKGGGKVHLRLRNEQDEKEIRAACYVTVAEYPLLKDPVDGKEKYQRFESEKVNIELLFEMSWDKNIVGWEDLFDKNEKPIPVTKENKILLMKLVPEFREAVTEGLNALKEMEQKKAEELPKN